jgi:hypothetical protein
LIGDARFGNVAGMNFQTIAASFRWHWMAVIPVAFLLMGCASSAFNWDSRVGTYTWEDAVTELGEPNRVTELEGGVTAAEWIRTRSFSPAAGPDPSPELRGQTVLPDERPGRTAPSKILRLSFTPDGKLLDWSSNY